MKLSKAQNEVMAEARKQIDEARSMDYPEWLRTTNDYFQVPTWLLENKEFVEFKEKKYQDAVNREYMKEYWEMHKNGIAFVFSNSRTIKRLEQLGLIEIVNDGRSNIDSIKVLNY